MNSVATEFRNIAARNQVKKKFFSGKNSKVYFRKAWHKQKSQRDWKHTKNKELRKEISVHIVKKFECLYVNFAFNIMGMGTLLNIYYKFWNHI